MRTAIALPAILLLGVACSGVGSQAPIAPAATMRFERDADVPDLPFADNPDANACGIPTLWHGTQAWLNGTYRGRLIEPTVHLYDSHERRHVTGTLPSGTSVQVELYQANPVLDFYFVGADTPSGRQTGWVPAPFLRFTPPDG